MNYPKFSNKAVAKILREIAVAYEVKGEDFFRVRAYDNAADAVEHAPGEIKDLWEEGNLREIAGIGESIEGYLEEYFKTGKVRHFDEVKEGLPEGMFKILGVPGIGAKRAYRLASELGIKDLEDLKEACRKHKVLELTGFGEELERDILKGIEELEARKERVLLPIAFSIAEKITAYLKENKKVLRADPLGSLRRGVSTVGDIDIGVATKDGPVITKYFTDYPEVKKVVSVGDIKATVILKSGYQVDIVTQKPSAYGSLLQYFTGSKAHNIHLRTITKEQGLSASEHGIKLIESGRTIEFASEEDFYRFLGLAFIPPELREDAGEIEAAKSGKLPNLVDTQDILCDLHTHSDFIEGENTVEEMVVAAKGLGYSYLGISDHNPSLKARGLAQVNSDIDERKDLIESVTQKLNYPVFCGMEVSITTDGSLALPKEILEKLDYVIGSIHTSLRGLKEMQTRRILAAIRNPYVDIIGHPTGRLLNEREGYEVDFDEVFEACLKHNKALEINAYPSRLDLPDTLAREAVNRGVKLAVGSDAHSVEGLNSLRFGVMTARRGWAEKGDIINTWNFEKMKRWLVGRRPRKISR